MFEFLQEANKGTTVSSSHTFSNQNLGDADADRYIIACIYARSGQTGRTISGVTIGGVTATEVQTNSADSDKSISAIYIANVPTGTTGDVVVNFTDGKTCGIGLYRVVGLDSATPSATGGDSSVSGTNLSTSINVPTNGIVIATSMSASGTINTTVSYAGVTEDYEVFATDSNTYSGGKAEVEAGETGRTVSATWSDSGTNALSVATWSASGVFPTVVTPTALALQANDTTPTKRVLVSPDALALSLKLIQGHISGSVTISGSPVEGATIRLVNQTDGSYVADTTTDASGDYEFNNIGDGAKRYHVVVEYEDTNGDHGAAGQKYNAKSNWDIQPGTKVSIT